MTGRTRTLTWKFCRALRFTKMKRSQIQMSETIAVLFVFFVLLGLGFIFYGKYMETSVVQAGEESAKLRSVAIVQKIMFLPELECNSKKRSNCIDLLKVEAAKEAISKNQLYYYDIFENSEINISEIYPEERNFALYSRKLTEFSNIYETSVPVALLDPIAGKYSFGMIKVKTYVK